MSEHREVRTVTITEPAGDSGTFGVMLSAYDLTIHAPGSATISNEPRRVAGVECATLDAALTIAQGWLMDATERRAT